MRLANVYLALAALLAPSIVSAADLTGSETCTPRMCVRTILDTASQKLTYTLTSVGIPQGWYAVGTGSEMSGSTMWVVWSPDGSSIMWSERQAFGHRAPSVVTMTTATYIPGSSLVNTTNLKATWTVPFAGTPSSAYPLIWGVNEDNNPGGLPANPIFQHSAHGHITVDLTQPLAADGAVKQIDAQTSRYETLIQAHAIVMALTWELVAPLAILIARYGRGFASRWLALHRGIQALGTALLTTIGFALAVAAIYSRPGPKAPHATHEYIGIVVFAMIWPQLLGGWWVHRKYSALRSRRSVRNWGHMVFGMGLLLLAWANMWLGIKLYHNGEKWQRVLWILWAALLIILFIIGYALIPRQLAQEYKARRSEMVGMDATSTGPNSPTGGAWPLGSVGNRGDLNQSNVWARESGELDKVPMSNVHISPTPDYQGVPEAAYRPGM